MPKLKTHKGTAKRIKKTKTGKLIHGSPNTSHFLSKKRADRKRRLSRPTQVAGKRRKTINRQLGA